MYRILNLFRLIVISITLYLASIYFFSVPVTADNNIDYKQSLLDKNAYYSKQAEVQTVTNDPIRQIVAPQMIDMTDLTPEYLPADNKADFEWYLHPAFGFEPGGTMLRGFEYYQNNSDPGPIPWQYSTDNGTTWSNYCYFTLYGYYIDGWYPSVDYSGGGTKLFGTHVIPTSFYNGGGVVLFEFDDPIDPGSWAGYWSDFSDNGWYNMRTCEITCDNSQQIWNWGMISAIMSKAGAFAAIDAPHIYSQLDVYGHAQLLFYPNYPGCLTTSADIDHVTSKAYAVYDRLDTDDNQWQLFVRKDDFSNWFNPTYAATICYIDSDLHLKYPALAADGDIVVIAAQTYEASDPGNIDIVCWATDDGDVSNIAFLSTIASGIGAETYPELSHLGGSDFVCTFIINEQLFASVSQNGGQSWSTPFCVSAGGEPVIDDHRSHDICDGGGNVMWEYQSADDILLMISALNCLDGDSDGICDDQDNCPSTTNPLQTDTDTDGIGDLCDNCSQDDNSDQADADHDGIGDVCDICTDKDNDGYGDPGYPANTCPLDNCPVCFNPDQADSNSDGIGDACDTYLCGDANSDTNINVGDAVFITNFIFHDGPEPEPIKSGDANDDDNVNIGDAVYLVNHIFKEGPEPCSD